ncbi:MAG: formylglycine-generating enzyme family protein [Gemmataceae bacterium]|nr:formylglycine-generating enzyme family protein [Gemmataceae bacterium]
MTLWRTSACLLALAVPGLLFDLAPPVGSAQGDDKAITNSIGMKLALIPAGKFVMGSPPGEEERDPEELPHEVVIRKPFYLGVHEVTQAQLQEVTGKNPSFFHARNNGGPDHPADQVPWNDAVAFCQKLSALPAEKKAGRVYRLPTEAEWEYACRAGTTTPFHFGKSLSSAQANFNGMHPYGGARGPYLERTAKAGSYAPNAWGLYDMHGNVWEWCQDWYDPAYYKRSPREDPQGPDKGVVPTGFRNQFFRVVRGGCWLEEGRGCRSAYRFRLMPDERYRWVGFRVVCVKG